LGELREPLRALERATAFLLTEPSAEWESWLVGRFPAKPRFVCRKSADGLYLGAGAAALEGAPYGAFCGIADPESFRAALSPFGEPRFFEAFSDHHVYTEEQLSALERSAKGAALVTTEKDWHRLPRRWKARVHFLRIKLEMPPECLSFIEASLERRERAGGAA
jgi:tetraacyldisaccharide 4'-kinase